MQGLRAIAVVLVVVYHLAPNVAPGGYVGVDVFFVVSGFLISGHLIKEVRDTGTIRVVSFWAKRVRRLLPSAIVVLAATFVGVVTLLPIEQWRANFIALVGSATYFVNWIFAANSVNYMNAEAAATAAQQFWSLAVEEQYYIVWPLLILVVVWATSRIWSGGARFSSVRLVLILIFLSSLAWSIYQTATNQPFAYFSTATRVWEFAAGAIVSLSFRRPRTFEWLPAPVWRVARVSVSLLGLIAILAAGFSGAINAATPYPGYFALVPVIGTVLVIVAGDSGTRWELGYLARFGPVASIANLSYAIYLWHWPLVVFYPYVAGQPLGARGALLVAGATVILAGATKWLVEDPLRFRPYFLNVRRTFTIAAGGMAAILVLGAGGQVYLDSASEISASKITVFEDVQAIHSEVATTLSSHRWELPSEPQLTPIWTVDDCLTVDSLQKIDACTYGDPDGTKTVVVVGDSVATTWMPGIIGALASSGWKVLPLTMEQCPAVDAEVFKYPTFAPYLDCDEHRTWVIDQIERIDPQLVVVASAGEESLARLASQATGEAADAEWGAGMAEYLKKVTAVSNNVVVLGSPPVPNCTKEITDPSSCHPSAEAVEQARVSGEVEANLEAGSTFIDTRQWFCDQSLTLCPAQIGAGVVRVDNTHLTVEYAHRLNVLLRDALVGAR